MTIDWDKTDPNIWEMAKLVALETNGGDWDKDYTEGQKRGWYLVTLNLKTRYEHSVDFVHFVANDYVELSHDKIRWQRDDYMRRAGKTLEKMYREPQDNN